MSPATRGVVTILLLAGWYVYHKWTSREWTAEETYLPDTPERRRLLIEAERNEEEMRFI
jgi:hypothetical protein